MKSLNGKQTLVRFAVLIAFTLAIAAVAAQAQNSKTQSLINEIKAEFPERQKQISEGCGGASVMVDVDFASFGDNYDALLKVPQQGLKETANGFRRHCTNSNRTSEQDPAKVDAVKAKSKRWSSNTSPSRSKRIFRCKRTAWCSLRCHSVKPEAGSVWSKFKEDWVKFSKRAAKNCVMEVSLPKGDGSKSDKL
ncbi:MAG: hypothetical protein WKF84_18790 [Pyrinomonadaceae bacterium]